jgi:flavin-binding protein dodecin
MENHTYKLIEITGTSGKSIEDAIERAVEKAAESVDELRWFKVIETRGTINGDNVQQWQVTLKIGFTLKDSGISR